MLEYGFSLTRAFPCKNIIKDSVVTDKYRSQKIGISYTVQHSDESHCSSRIMDEFTFPHVTCSSESNWDLSIQEKFTSEMELAPFKCLFWNSKDSVIGFYSKLRFFVTQTFL